MYELLDQGSVASIHVGRLRRIPVAALHDYVERQIALVEIHSVKSGSSSHRQ
jgi:hypothetical protein